MHDLTSNLERQRSSVHVDSSELVYSTVTCQVPEIAESVVIVAAVITVMDFVPFFKAVKARRFLTARRVE